MTRLLLTLLSLVFLISTTFSQDCGLGVNAGNDTTLCAGGGLVELNGHVTGAFSSSNWVSDASINDPDFLSTSATITGFTEFILEVDVDDVDLVENGDFSDGNDGFYGDYNEWTSGLFLKGDFVIITSPSIVSSNFPPCTDHTDGAGNLMLVAGSQDIDRVWCQDIAVIPDEDYDLTAYVSTILPIEIAELRWQINGDYVGGIFSPSATPCDWNEMSEVWTCPAGVTTAEVCITNQNTAFLGNVFMLDDISITGPCRTRDTMYADLRTPEIRTTDTTICRGEFVTINGQDFNVAGSYDAGIGPGTDPCDAEYRLELEVLQIDVSDISIISAPCTGGLTDVDVTAFSNGGGLDYAWSTLDGDIVSGQFNNRMTAGQTGTYYLVISASRNGVFCDTSLSVFVTSNAITTTVDAGDDQEICAPGGDVQLDGSIDGDYVFFEWDPTTGLSDPEILDPVASVTTDITYTLTAYVVADPDQNLIDNGDFEQGNTIFETDYTYQPVGQLNEENYSMTTDGRCRNDWCTSPDHTSGAGQYMCINAATRGNIDVWRQNVPVTPNTYYLFSAWIITLFPNSPPILQFDINGENIGDQFMGSSNTCEWVNRGEDVWFSGTNTTATLRIVNRNTESFGNDFGIDDITLQELCEVSDQVTITVTPPERIIIDTVLCQNESIVVEGITYDTGGEYRDLEGTDADGCAIIIDLFIDEVILDINPQDTIPQLNCLDIIAQLNAEASTNLGSLSYQWTALEGTLQAPLNQSSVTTLGPGTFQVTVTATVGDKECTDSEIFFVEQDVSTPIADAGPDLIIDCDTDTLWLNGNNEINTIPNWEASGGGALWSRPDSSSVAVGTAGSYVYTLFDTITGCLDMDTLIISNNSVNFTISINTPDTLNCNISDSDLTVTIIGSDSTRISWSTVDGNYRGDSTGFTITALDTGTYIVTVIDTTANCEVSESITVVGDYSIPALLLPPRDTLGCSDTLKLNASAIPAGLPINWSTPSGTILFSNTGGAIWLTEPGIYVAEAVGQNGCSISDTLIIDADLDFPEINISIPEVLNCNNDTITIDASQSSAGNSISYLWTTDDGRIISDVTSPVIQVTDSGIYVLELINSDSGCRNVDSIRVLQDLFTPEFSIPATGIITCSQPELVVPINFITSRNNNDILLSLINGSSPGSIRNDSLVFIAAGNYVLSITDNISGCEFLDSIQVAMDTVRPVFNLSFTDTLTCLNTETNILVNTTIGHTNINAEWTGPNGGLLDITDYANIRVGRPGLYTLNLTDLTNGCSTSESILVPEQRRSAQINFTPPEEITCATDTVRAFVENILGELTNFEWFSNGTAIASSRSTRSQVYFTEAQTARLIYTLESSGCADTIDFVITENITAPTINLSPDQIDLCDGDDTFISSTITSVSSSISWTWELSDTLELGETSDPEFIVNQAGTYRLTATDLDNGCSATAEAIVNSIIQDFTVEITPPSCTRETAILEVGSNGSDNLLIILNGVVETDTILSLERGFYELELSSDGSCVLDTFFTISTRSEYELYIEPEFTIRPGECVLLDPFFSGEVNNISSIDWNNAQFELRDSNSLSGLVCPSVDTEYILNIITSDSCELEVRTRVDVLTGQVFIPQVFTPNGDKNNDIFTIQGDSGVERILEMRIFNRWGSQVYHAQEAQLGDPVLEWDGRFGGVDQNPGVFVYYFSVLFTDGVTRTYKGDITLLK